MTNPAALETDAEVHRLPTASDRAAAEAREQAKAYESIFANKELPLTTGGTVSLPPHPDFGLLDDDAMERYEELLFIADTTYEREPDVYVPEQRLTDAQGNETGVVVPSETVRGRLKQPYRIVNEQGKAELVKPPHSVKIVAAVLGDEDFARLKAGGYSAKDVWKIWTDQSMEVQARRKADAKSNAGTVAVAPVPEANSQ